MGYILVPVPEELVDRVGAFLQRKTAEPQLDPPRPDDEPLARVVRLLDLPCRELLLFVVDASLNNRILTISDVAASLGWNEREVVGAMFQTNQALRAQGVVAAAMMAISATGSPPGDSSWSDRFMAMSQDFARRVASLDRVHGDDIANPSLG